MPLEGRLESRSCARGGCRRALNNCGMPNCDGHSAQSEKSNSLIAEGKDRDDIVATFIRDFGSQDILIEPNDKGLNRFAWAFPYAMAGFGAVAGVIALRRWSRRASEQPRLAVAAPVGDAALQARSTASSKTSTGRLVSHATDARITAAVAVLHARRAHVRHRRGVRHSRDHRLEPHLRLPRNLRGGPGRSGGVRMRLTPLVTGEARQPEMVGSRTRVALEREKDLALRSIKELEFDHAMGKVADADFGNVDPPSLAHGPAPAGTR